MIKRTIQKIKEMRLESRRKDILDLTNDDYKNDKRWITVGLKLVTRPYHLWAVMVSLIIFILGFALAIIPLINPVTMTPMAIKFLGKFG